ncbi:2-phospho-L-lactate guanylyltransferase [Terracoccus luteus]|uniref:2-phospho-L-lactate guanylyltransferase n=1 Tax=Terracoccus luteus TaxID=53356 RepID=A0A839PTH8_9MICO|nr:2-phospho-L-lactate guanylyltransferase [Terracoccus luteus]MBB2985296.1 2-phospho-L-lactate guanylyltransferase [Terracoccus luteus]MCP2170948.1 2-phospho-L-lactate guanylyltransferase [Terracoccus luteus]
MSDLSPPTSPAPAPDWHVVVPVKDTRHGKSRLARSVGAAREPLARAIADDTLEAVVGAVGADRVIVVTSDAGLAAEWSQRGVHVVADPGEGLNAALGLGLAAVPTGCAAAALLGDLPALHPVELREALAAAARHDQSFVPDADGVGTVLRCGGVVRSGDGVPSGLPRPLFGAGSAARHEADGAVRLTLDLPRLRTDVDDLASLEAASLLGLGTRTQAVVSGLWPRASGWI